MEPRVKNLSISAILLIVSGLVLLLWDVIAYVKGYTTISTEITRFSMYSPILPTIVGILLGHWLWPTYIERDK